MDESLWKLTQIGMWFMGIQTGVLITILAAFHASMSKKLEKSIESVNTKLEKSIESVNAKLEKSIEGVNAKLEKSIDGVNARLDKLDQTVTDIDRRLCRLEGAFASKDCCMIKDERQIKKAE